MTFKSLCHCGRRKQMTRCSLPGTDISLSPTPPSTWAPSSPPICAMTLTAYRRVSRKPPHRWEPSEASSDTPTFTSRQRCACTSPYCSTPSSGCANHGLSLKKTRDNYKSSTTIAYARYSTSSNMFEVHEEQRIIMHRYDREQMYLTF